MVCTEFHATLHMSTVVCLSALEQAVAKANTQYIENRIYDEIEVGNHAKLTRTLKPQDIELFAVMSGDVNPAHVDADYAKNDMFHGIIAHGMWGGALISAVLNTQLPLKFMAPVSLGDTITVRVKFTEKQEKGRLLLACICVNQDGKTVIDGEARVISGEATRAFLRALPDLGG
jgi:phosphate acetyltransferase